MDSKVLFIRTIMKCVDNRAGNILSQVELVKINDELNKRSYQYLKNLNDLGQINFSSPMMSSDIDDGLFLDTLLNLLDGKPTPPLSNSDNKEKKTSESTAKLMEEPHNKTSKRPFTKDKINQIESLESDLEIKKSEIEELKEEVFNLKEQLNSEQKISNNNQEQTLPLNERTEKNYLKIIALLVKAFASIAPPKYGEKSNPNVSQIHSELENIMPPSGVYGVSLSSFSAHVKKGLELLE